MSKDTVNVRLTKNTHKELENLRKEIANIIGIDANNVTMKQAEIAMRVSAQKGMRNLKIKELEDILLGKIK